MGQSTGMADVQFVYTAAFERDGGVGRWRDYNASGEDNRVNDSLLATGTSVTCAQLGDKTDDLRAFERRLMEVIAHMQPRTTRYRCEWYAQAAMKACAVVLTGALLLLAYYTYELFADADTVLHQPLTTTLTQHVQFTCLLVALVSLLVIVGIHQKIFTPTIVASR
jgi:hypothetical protein